jgi:hypothetical protein
MSDEQAPLTKVFTSGDLKEGPHAFVEERPSSCTGR